MSTPDDQASDSAPGDRARFGADVTRARIVELELDPVRGTFNAAHLREVNRRIFQDMPSKGFTDVKPGEYRPEVAASDWMKNRGLETVPGNFFVAYSPTDAVARARIDAVLQEAQPVRLAQLDTREFTTTITKVYVELDYAHPFADGNSRTLRTFTRQLAGEAGFDVDWERFNRSPATRDALFAARDLSINAIALPRMRNKHSRLRVVSTMDRLASNHDLEQLLNSAVRPLRAIAFAQRPAAEALERHPELVGAYKVLAEATRLAAMIGDKGAVAKLIEQAHASVQATLEAGRLVLEPPIKDATRAASARPVASPTAHAVFELTRAALSVARAAGSWCPSRIAANTHPPGQACWVDACWLVPAACNEIRHSVQRHPDHAPCLIRSRASASSCNIAQWHVAPVVRHAWAPHAKARPHRGQATQGSRCTASISIRTVGIERTPAFSSPRRPTPTPTPTRPARLRI